MDYIDEELQIMNEEDKTEKTLGSQTFKQLIEKVELPPVKSLDESCSIKDAVETMQKGGFGSVVITKDKKISGILTERDILMKTIGIISDLDNTSVTKIMTADPTCLRKDDMIAYVMNNMHVGGYRHVPIIDEEGRPIAMFSIKDIMRFILDHFPEEIMNLTGEPWRGKSTREGA